MRLKVLLIAANAPLASIAQLESALASTTSIYEDFNSGIMKAAENGDIYRPQMLEYEL